MKNSFEIASKRAINYLAEMLQQSMTQLVIAEVVLCTYELTLGVSGALQVRTRIRCRGGAIRLGAREAI
jgi:hypothetical protein